MYAAELWTSTSLVAKAVVLALAGMWVVLAVITRDLFSRSNRLRHHAGRLAQMAEQPRTDIPRPNVPALKRQTCQLATDLDERLWSLVGLIFGAPLLGLFGTLTGLTTCLVGFVPGGPLAEVKLRAAIAEALVTTLVGLALALAATIMWTFHRTRSSRLQLRLDTVLAELADTARQPTGSAPGRSVSL